MSSPAETQAECGVCQGVQVHGNQQSGHCAKGNVSEKVYPTSYFKWDGIAIAMGLARVFLTPEYECVLKKLVEMRKTAGITNRQLASKLQRENSFVWRIEHGERRLDVVEFFWVCNALGYDAAEVYSELCTAFARAK